MNLRHPVRNNMEVKVTIQSKALSKEELRCLLQSIRDCEQEFFPDREISIWIEVPELTTVECTEILTSIRPPYKYGPSVRQIRFGGCT